MTAGCAQEAATNQAVNSPIAGSPVVVNPAPGAPQATPPSPSSTAQMQKSPGAQATVLRSGTFVDGEHPTKGMVRLIKEGNNHVIELDQAFSTSTSGPDLVVILHRSADVIGSTTPPAFAIKEGDYVLIAPLKEYNGAQRYTVPANINPDQFKSAAIWCRQFNATFGSATLQ